METEEATVNEEEGHHTPEQYHTYPLDTKNILGSNKGSPFSKFQPPFRDFIFRKDSGLRKPKRNALKKPSCPFYGTLKISHIKLEILPGDGQIDIIEDDIQLESKNEHLTQFRGFIQDSIGNFFEEKLFQEQYRVKYAQYREKASKYKQTTTFISLQTRIVPDRYPKTSLKPKTIIIGLGEVLAIMSMEEAPGSLALPIVQDSMHLGTVYVSFREFAYEFLDYLVAKYEIIVYCSGTELYCSLVLDKIEKKHKYFSYRIYSDASLFCNQENNIKFYDFLFNSKRTPKNTIIVDKDVPEFCLNLGNGVPVTSLSQRELSEPDKELPCLAKYLDYLWDLPDINNEIEKTIEENEIVEFFRTSHESRVIDDVSNLLNFDITHLC